MFLQNLFDPNGSQNRTYHFNPLDSDLVFLSILATLESLGFVPNKPRFSDKQLILNKDNGSCALIGFVRCKNKFGLYEVQVKITGKRKDRKTALKLLDQIPNLIKTK